MQRREIWGWAAVYGLWAVTVALGIVLLIVTRQSLGIVLEVAGTDEMAVMALDRFFMLFVSLAVVVVIVFAEHYYRVGYGRQLLLPRAARLIGIELLVLMVSHTIPQLVLGAYGSWLIRLVILAEGAAGIALIAVSVRLTHQRGKRRRSRN